MIIVTCRDLTELCTDRREGQLGLAERAGIGVHLSWCKTCRRYLEQMDLAVEALGALPDEPVSTETRAALRARFRR